MKKYQKLLLSLVAIQVIVNSSCSRDNKLSLDGTRTEYHEKQFIMVSESFLEPIIGQVYCLPTIIEILNSEVVQQQMKAAWKMMIDSCTPLGRCESGFWIYFNLDDSTFCCSEIVDGEMIDYKIGTGAHIKLPKVTESTNLKVCCFVHVHTSLHFAPSGMQRTIGPSSGDINTANFWQIPAIVIDYNDSVIYSGHPLDDSCRVYTFGPEYRTYIVY